MGEAKNIVLRPITAAEANAVIKRCHYSGKVVQNSQLHIGVFYLGRLEGAMQFGPSLDKRKMLGLVEGTAWNEFIELNRMAFSDALPRNSESRAIAVAVGILRKHAPQIKWIVSFSDATQCGDGTIYRAAGFVLTGLKSSKNIVRLPGGDVIHKMTLESNPTSARPELGGRSYYDVTGGKFDFGRYVSAARASVVPGFQLRYIYFVDPTARQRLTVPVIPFSRIEEMGAGMYKGRKTLRAGSIESDAPADQAGEGGANPTPALHLEAPSEPKQGRQAAV